MHNLNCFVRETVVMDFSKYNDQPEFQTALKEMFSSLDDSVLNNPRYAPVIEKIIEPDRIIKDTII